MRAKKKKTILEEFKSPYTIWILQEVKMSSSNSCYNKIMLSLFKLLYRYFRAQNFE